MTDYELSDILITCRDTSDVLASIENEFLLWAKAKGKLLKQYMMDLRKLREASGRLSEEWHDMAAGQVAAGKIFTNRGKTRKFLHTHRYEMHKDAIELLRHFMENRWFYCLFGVDESPEKDFYWILDYCSDRRLLLYSPALTKLRRMGVRLFLSLLFFNGDCYQTYGPMHYYRGFQAMDFEFFAKMINPYSFEENGLSFLIANRPAFFLLLDGWAEVPMPAHEGEVIYICSDSIALASFDPHKYEHSLDMERKNDLVKCSLKGSKRPFGNANLYYDGQKKKLLLYAIGMERYQILVHLLAGDCELPSEPYWHGTILMAAAAKKLLGKSVPAVCYENEFEEEVSPNKPEGLDNANAMLKELNRYRNSGIAYSLEEVAGRYEIPMETAQKMEDLFTHIKEKFNLDIEGGFEDFQPPPPNVRIKFQRLLSESEIFDWSESEIALRHFEQILPDLKKSATGEDEEDLRSLSLSSLPSYLEDLYYRTWDAQQPLILNYSLYLLCKKGGAFHSVRDYAVEVLRLFWQVILSDKDKICLEGFIEKYALFFFEVMHRLGLIEMDREIDRNEAANADYLLQASSLFSEWVKLSPYLERQFPERIPEG